MVPEDLSAYVAQVRPHNRYRDGGIFFLISRRQQVELPDEQAPLYWSIDGSRSVAELETLHPGARATLLKWRDDAIIELIPPFARPSRPHLVVVEPHMDDAVLSVGGRLLHRRGRSRTTVLSAVTFSNITSYLQSRRNFFDVREVTELRLQESHLAAKFLGAEFRCLGCTDAPLRFWPAARWSLATVDSFNRNPQAFSNTFPDPKQVLLLAEQLTHELEALEPDELWIPMGLGNHVDHRTTRSACLLMLAESGTRFSGIPVALYEDIPYAATLGHAARIRVALSDCGTPLVRATEDITDVFEDKLRAISIYASQFKASAMEPTIRRLAEREGGGAGRLGEAYYLVAGQVRPPSEISLSWECAGLRKLRAAARALHRSTTTPRSLTVIALPTASLGKWTRESDYLAGAFPNADLRIYASEEVAWQTEEGGNRRLTVHFVRGMLAWATVMWREFLRFGVPTVVLWRGAYAAAPKARRKMLVNVAVSSLLPFRPVLLASSLSDLCRFLDRQVEERP